MTEATKRPWHFNVDELRIETSDGDEIAAMDEVDSMWDESLKPFDNAQANAAHIVKCVNEHDGLAERESAFLRLMDADHCNWTRWHDLLTIRDGRGFDPDEQIEYDAFSKIVAMLDERDDAVGRHAEAATTVHLAHNGGRGIRP